MLQTQYNTRLLIVVDIYQNVSIQLQRWKLREVAFFFYYTAEKKDYFCPGITLYLFNVHHNHESPTPLLPCPSGGVKSHNSFLSFLALPLVWSQA